MLRTLIKRKARPCVPVEDPRKVSGFVVPVSQIAMLSKTKNPIYANTVAEYVERFCSTGRCDYPIEVYKGTVVKRSPRFVDGHVGKVGEIVWFLFNGHHRAVAAVRLGWVELPAVRVDVLTSSDVAAYGNPYHLPVEDYMPDRKF